MKLTVNLTPRVWAVLNEVAAQNEENKTQAINRAIQMYAFLTKQMVTGSTLLLIDSDGREQRVAFF